MPSQAQGDSQAIKAVADARGAGERREGTKAARSALGAERLGLRPELFLIPPLAGMGLRTDRKGVIRVRPLSPIYVSSPKLAQGSQDPAPGQNRKGCRRGPGCVGRCDA